MANVPPAIMPAWLNTVLQPLYDKIESQDKIIKSLTERMKKIESELKDLKYSLVYRNMAARITATQNRVDKAKKSQSKLESYLKRSAGQENSKINTMKKRLHSKAHGKFDKKDRQIFDKKGEIIINKSYKVPTKFIDKMHKDIYKSTQKKNMAQQWKQLTESAKREHNARWNKEYRNAHPSAATMSVQSKRSSIPSLGSTIRNPIVYETLKPMHKVLQNNKHRDWHANRFAAQKRK